MSDITTQERAPARAVSRASVALAFFAFIMIGANDGAFGVLLPRLLAYYQVDNTTIGLLFFFSTIGYFIGTFNNGILMEKLGMRRFFIVGGATMLLGMVIYSLRPPFLLAPVAALLAGLGVALIDAGLNSYIASLPSNTALLNYLHAFYGAGAWLGPFVASTLLALNWGWNNIYMLWGGMCLLVIIGVATFFQALPPAHEETTQSRGNNMLAQALRLRVVWLGAAFLFFYVGAELVLGNWGFSFLTTERHGDELISGWVVSGYWLGLTLGRLVLGKVGQVIGNKRLIQGCLVGVAVGLLLVWWGPIQFVTYLGLWLTGFCLGPLFPTIIALLSTLVSGRLLPTAIGFVVSLGSMGAALFPWLAGNLAQHSGLWVLMPFVIVQAALMMGLWLFLQRKPEKVEG
ncbi:MAG: MFS transporter [Ktedonobacteraceae bacterium]|nr:MFS transporter [Ktedonobacteraceae bacterium]